MATTDMRSSSDRAHTAVLNDCYGHRLVDLAPDHRIPFRLRRELERALQLDMPFDEAFESSVDYILAEWRRGASNRATQSNDWRTVFLSTESAWRQAYEGTGDPCPSLARLVLSDL